MRTAKVPDAAPVEGLAGRPYRLDRGFLGRSKPVADDQCLFSAIILGPLVQLNRVQEVIQKKRCTDKQAPTRLNGPSMVVRIKTRRVSR